MKAGIANFFSKSKKKERNGGARNGKPLSSYLLVPAFSIFVLAAIWVITTLLIKTERITAEHASSVLTQELLSTYEAQATRALHEIDQTLKLVKYANETPGGKRGLPDLRARGLLPPDLLFLVFIADENGNVLTSSRPPSSPIKVDKKILETLRRSGAIAVSAPLQGSIPTEPMIQFGRQLTTPDGAFAGAVVILVAADYFVSG